MGDPRIRTKPAWHVLGIVMGIMIVLIGATQNVEGGGGKTGMISFGILSIIINAVGVAVGGLRFGNWSWYVDESGGGSRAEILLHS